MSQNKPEETLFRDPLREVTRKERTLLLGVSAIGIIMVRAGLIPTKISALGIEFTQTDRRSLLLIIAVINLYFLVAFIIYAASDYLSWRVLYEEASGEISRKVMTPLIQKRIKLILQKDVVA